MSWVVTCLVTGRVWEMFDRRDADKARQIKSAKVEPIGEYLARINQEVRT